MNFNGDVFYGYLAKGRLRDAIAYCSRFPECAEVYGRYMAVFEKEEYHTYEVDDYLNQLLLIYQRYYRDTFYLEFSEECAAENMRQRFAGFLGLADAAEQEKTEKAVSDAFRSRGFSFLGGRTSGYYGPYIWKTTEEKTYEVELPEGAQLYTVRLLDGFVSNSWLDYISFGKISTGGWTDADGIINCVKASYDLDSENFTVSLLKHEAQHAMDFAKFPDMSSEDLEYRAKLVELIYSSKRNLLEQFAQEADNSDKRNGHAMAAHRIVKGFAQALCTDVTDLTSIPFEQIQSIAQILFKRSSNEITSK